MLGIRDAVSWPVFGAAVVGRCTGPAAAMGTRAGSPARPAPMAAGVSALAMEVGRPSSRQPQARATSVAHPAPVTRRRTAAICCWLNPLSPPCARRKALRLPSCASTILPRLSGLGNGLAGGIAGQQDSEPGQGVRAAGQWHAMAGPRRQFTSRCRAYQGLPSPSAQARSAPDPGQGHLPRRGTGRTQYKPNPARVNWPWGGYDIGRMANFGPGSGIGKRDPGPADRRLAAGRARLLRSARGPQPAADDQRPARQVGQADRLAKGQVADDRAVQR